MLYGTGFALLLLIGMGLMVGASMRPQKEDITIFNATQKAALFDGEKQLKRKQVQFVKPKKSNRGDRDQLVDEFSYEIIGQKKLYDPKFIKQWWKMIRQLWTADGGKNGVPEPMPSSSIEFMPRTDEVPFKARKIFMEWTSPDCKFVDLNLRHVKTIQDDDSSNEVLLMRDTRSEKKYIIKTISNPSHFFSEISFFMFLDPKHPYFSKAVCHRRVQDGSDEDPQRVKIIFEYVEGTESLDYARTAKVSDLKRIAAQLFLAIEHMHYLNFVHADLKPNNVLVDSTGTIKVIDFGFTTQLPYTKTKIGTHFTMAPELHSQIPGPIHEGIDWWAYGATVAMWFGAHYDEKRYREVNRGKASTNRNGHQYSCILMDWMKDHFQAGEVPDEFPAELRSFLYLFFSVDPDTRVFNTPRLLKLIRKHEFFADLNWSELYGGRLESRDD